MRAIAILAALLCVSVALAAPTTAPTTAPAPPPAGNYELQEWVVLIVNANQSNANATNEFPSSLPGFVPSRRSTIDKEKLDQPMPIGVIRFVGSQDERTKTDVLLELKTGTFDSHWPKAESKSNRLLWKNLVMSAEPPRMNQLEPASWYNGLRKADSAYLSYNGHGDRVLVYDAEFPFKMPVKVTGENNKYKVANVSEDTLTDLEFYKPTPEGWQVGTLAKLKGAASRPSTKPATTRAATTQDVFVREGEGATTKPADETVTRTGTGGQVATETRTRRIVTVRPGAGGRASATTGASTGPTTVATSQPAVDVALTASGAKEIPVDRWKERLTTAGLSNTDMDLILGILRRHVPDKQRLTAVYRLTQEDMDRLIPEDVVPSPKKTTRVGLVILRNIDPGISKEVDALIAQLGDNDWNKREAAQKALAELGRAAQPQLQSATRNKDLEIAYRAEKLLRTIGSPAQPQGGRR
jgi:hypothetical protein